MSKFWHFCKVGPWQKVSHFQSSNIFWILDKFLEKSLKHWLLTRLTKVLAKRVVNCLDRNDSFDKTYLVSLTIQFQAKLMSTFPDLISSWKRKCLLLTGKGSLSILKNIESTDTQPENWVHLLKIEVFLKCSWSPSWFKVDVQVSLYTN